MRSSTKECGKNLCGLGLNGVSASEIGSVCIILLYVLMCVCVCCKLQRVHQHEDTKPECIFELLSIYGVTIIFIPLVEVFSQIVFCRLQQLAAENDPDQVRALFRWEGCKPFRYTTPSSQVYLLNAVFCSYPKPCDLFIS